MIGMRDIIRIVEGVNTAPSFVLDPALNPKNYKITNSLRQVESWRAMTYAANNGGKVDEMSPVGYIMISLTTNQIIPISREDEHHRGFDLLQDLNDKNRRRRGPMINIKDYVPIFFTGCEYIYTQKDIPKLLVAAEKFLSYGGKNGLLKGASDMSGKAMMLQQFVDAKGNMVIKPGTIAPIGQLIFNAMKNLAAATNKAVADPHSKTAIALAGKAAVDLLKIFDGLGYRAYDYFDDAAMESWPGMVREFVREGDAQGLQNMFFGFPSIKNMMHVKLKEMNDPKNHDYETAKAIWGDVSLAIDMLSDRF